MGFDAAWIGLAITCLTMLVGAVRYFHTQISSIQDELDDRLDQIERAADKAISDRLIDKEKYQGVLEKHDAWLHQVQQTIVSLRRELLSQGQSQASNHQVTIEKLKLELQELNDKVQEIQLYLAKFTTGDHSAPYKPRSRNRG
ncbi:MAG TPA: hypothetical protein V6C46_10405 [Coleofasciculaceae cyanobacterium]